MAIERERERAAPGCDGHKNGTVHYTVIVQIVNSSRDRGVQVGAVGPQEKSNRVGDRCGLRGVAVAISQSAGELIKLLGWYFSCFCRE